MATFESVLATLNFSRGLFGKPRNSGYIENVLRDLSLWEKRNSRIMELSGGMKRRVLIAKALSHEPSILFLDEPTAGIDVEQRHSMWEMVRGLRDQGVTIILTTHYIEEAEEMADRIGVINRGEISVVEEKDVLMKKLGSKQLELTLQQPLAEIPAGLSDYSLELVDEGEKLVYTFDIQKEHTGISRLLRELAVHDIDFRDMHTRQTSLEDIFVSLVKEKS
jgi:ABC-2 type transport system ATP-binding protein